MTEWFSPPRYIFRKYNLLQEIKKLKDIQTFLDAGCGAGDIACSLAKLGLSGEGIDFSPKAIDIANNRKVSLNLDDSKIKFIVGDVKNLSRKYDLILSLEVLEHIKEDGLAFKELVAHSEKYIVISVPAKKNLYGYSDRLVGHYRRYDKQDIKKLFNMQGIEIMKIISYGFPFTNIIRIFRERKAKKLLSEREGETKETLSKDSGLNMVGIKQIFKVLLSEKTLFPFIKISQIFNRFDLSEGYLIIGKIKPS